MTIGDLNKTIELQAPSKTPDGMGGMTISYNTVATEWAAIWPTSAKEQLQNAQQIMTISHRIRIRYRANVKASWRIKFDTRYFNIVSIINPNEENRYIDIMCKEAT